MYNPNLWFNQKLEKDDRIYHIVYLTTNLVNQKIYVGIHSTNNLNDGYLGSGELLQFAIEKYGKNNFKRDILYFCFSRNETLKIENFIVDTQFVLKDTTYNKSIGGSANPILMGHHNPMFGRIHSEEAKEKMSELALKRYEDGQQPSMLGKHHSDITKEKISKFRKGKAPWNKGLKGDPRQPSLPCSEEKKQKISKANSGINNPFYGKTHSEETKQKIKESLLKRREKTS
jgi:group I intron endonuclease